jgi:hypothetical protein
MIIFSAIKFKFEEIHNKFNLKTKKLKKFKQNKINRKSRTFNKHPMKFLFYFRMLKKYLSIKNYYW